MPRTTTDTIRRIVTAARDAEMTPYADDPDVWTRQARGRLANICRRHGIRAEYKITVMVNDALNRAQENSELGDFQALRAHLVLGMREDRLMKRNWTRTKELQDLRKSEATAYAKTIGVPVHQIDNILRKLEGYRTGDPALWTIEQAEALLDEYAAKHKSAIRGADTTGKTLPRPKSVSQMTPAEYRSYIMREADNEAAGKTVSAQVASMPASELDEFLGPRKTFGNGHTAVTEQAAFFAIPAHLRKTYNVQNVTKYLDDIFGEHFTQQPLLARIGVETAWQMVDEYDEQHANMNTPANGTTGAEVLEDKQPMPALPLAHTESPVTCYPKYNGGFIYRDFRFDGSLRYGGTMAMILALADEFVEAHLAGMIDLSDCIANKPRPDATDIAEHTERRANAEPAPAQPYPVDGGTRKSMQIVGISRHTADNQITYKLYTTLSNGKEAAYPTPVVKDFDLHALLAALEVSGRDAKAIEKNMEFGKRIPISGMYTWVERKPIPDKPGKFYHDDNQYTFEPRV